MKNKGRSSRLISKRNVALASRFYYWTEVKRLRFDDAIRQLSENEFFISESRIIKIINSLDNVEKIRIKTLRCPKLTPEQLKLFKEENKNG
ncbi:MAG: transposase [Candidatus Egerieousia sp.]